MKSLLRAVRGSSRYCGFAAAVALLAFLLLIPATSFAAAASGQQKCAAKDLQCVITFGNTQITARITALNTLDGKVTTEYNNHHIDDTHSDALHADIKTNIDGLNNLKTQLDAETSEKSARTDVDNIYAQFRIYAVVLPRDYRRLHLAVEIYVDNVLEGLKGHIQTVVNNAPADKKTQATNLFNDYTTQLSNAESQIDTAQSTWPSLTPANYNTDRTTYTNNANTFKTSVDTAHSDLHTAASDLHQIAQLLK